MKNFLLLIGIFCVQLTSAQIKPTVRIQVTPPADSKKFWLFLLAGQSNMAGRGTVEATDTIPNAHVLTLNKNGAWEIAKDPIHFDRDYAGVGPGLTFGKAMADADTSIYIGLIPCAVGGSAINSWKSGEDQSKSHNNFREAIARCRIAMQNGVLKGIVWHQGETNCTEKGSLNYQQKFAELIEGFRMELNMPGLPFVAGQLPAFQKQQPNKNHQLQNNPYIDQINMAISGLKGKINHYDYVVTKNTEHRGDHLHFNSVSARLMGKRYALLMKTLLKSNK